MTEDYQTQEHLDQIYQESMSNGPKQKRSAWETFKKVIDNLGYVFKGALILAIIAGAVWYFGIRSTGSSTAGHAQTVSSSTVSVSGGKTTDAPSGSTSRPTAPKDLEIADGITVDDRAVGSQMLYLQIALTSCLYTNHALKIGSAAAARYCSEPGNLNGTGYTWGTGPDQVQATLNVNMTVTRIPHKVTFAGGGTEIIYSNRTDTSVGPSVVGKTASGTTLTAEQATDEYVYNSDGDVLFWLNSGLLPPCSSPPYGPLSGDQMCLVQPTAFDGTTVTAWAPNVIVSK